MPTPYVPEDMSDEIMKNVMNATTATMTAAIQDIRDVPARRTGEASKEAYG